MIRRRSSFVGSHTAQVAGKATKMMTKRNLLTSLSLAGVAVSCLPMMALGLLAVAGATGASAVHAGTGDSIAGMGDGTTTPCATQRLSRRRGRDPHSHQPAPVDRVTRAPRDQRLVARTRRVRAHDALEWCRLHLHVRARQRWALLDGPWSGGPPVRGRHDPTVARDALRDHGARHAARLGDGGESGEPVKNAARIGPPKMPPSPPLGALQDATIARRRGGGQER